MKLQVSQDATLGDAARLEEAAQLRRLEIASMIEATTLAVLVGVAMPLKHLAGWSIGVRCLGPIHGVAFLFYCWMVIQTVAGGGWRRLDILRLFVVAFVPLAGYFNLGWIQHRRSALLRFGDAACP